MVCGSQDETVRIGWTDSAEAADGDDLPRVPWQWVDFHQRCISPCQARSSHLDHADVLLEPSHLDELNDFFCF